MGTVDIPNWLKGLPLAPEFRPTDTEFSDPIAYISKIEKEAGAFGICKVIPPLPKPTKKYTFSNLNRSLSRSPDLGSDTNTVHSSSRDKENDGVVKAVFTTRQQELGHSSRRTKGAISVRQSAIHKQVWQSGEVYTLEQFESKSKVFARSQLGMIKEVTPLVIEALFWKAASEKPIYLEYANDVPGSGFGEPEFPSQCTRKRWRKRKVNKNRLGAIDCEKRQTDSLRNSNVDEEVNVSGMDDIDPSSEMSKQSPSSSTLLSDEGSRVSRQKSPNAGSDKEGTAGWKLTNSPWNLQVIARSAGSLTRFMLDDIPGVTSPMIYIGMLFSWFAWHVEDHELHSLNYLHSGSSKTWYAVPGDHAFAFEEVIRAKGYGGNIDRLAALMLLGEKTNLLSPEAVVASGIPCCRLVQNPGEFVVTFPRAYHVGFSHGFNCGEAANFGTPQWLKVAKEAAVRRAAMNYLPMLSHQQLLYLLTMSFISSVPRALLPGARSSRLRDRQKEERELVVKKAFIDDMLKENNLVSALLRKESTLYAVLWDPETLPSPCKDLQSLPLCATSGTTFSLYGGSDIEVCNSVQTISSSDNLHGDTSNGSTVSIEKSFSVDPINADSCNNQVDPERSYMETVEDMNKVDDDLPCGLQADSGTLVCVACGILGFPFMSIVQPSRSASEELFNSANSQVIQDERGDSKSVKPQSLSELDDTVKHSVSDTQCTQNVNWKGDLSSKYNVHTSTTEAPNSSSVVRSIGNNLEKLASDATSSIFGASEDLEVKESNKHHHPITSIKTKSSMSCTADASPVPDPLLIYPKEKLHKQWNRSNGFLRPRVFCLEHTLEIEELLRSKGGANVLIICHSAFPKIKAHASAVAEEIGTPFNCEEVPLKCASQEDLDLINISIDDEEHEECGEDWTSRMGVNLQYGVKLRKQFPSKQDQHALSLGGLFSEMVPCSDVPCLKWSSRKSRTSHKAAGPPQSKFSEKTKVKEGMPLETSLEKSKGNKETKVIQYTRRVCNGEKGLPSQATVRSLSCFRKHQPQVTSTATEILDSNILMSEDTHRSPDHTENDAQELTKAPTVEISEISHGTSVQNRERNEFIGYGNLVSSPVAGGRNDDHDTTVPTMENFELQHNAQIPGQTTGVSVAGPSSLSAGLLINERLKNDSVELANSDMVSSTDETKPMVEISELATTPALDISTLGVSGAEMGNTTMKGKVVKNTQDKVSDPAQSPCSVELVVGSEAQQGSTSLVEYSIENELEASQRCKVSNPVASPTMAVLSGEISQARRGNQIMEESNMEQKGCNHLNMDNSQMEIVIQTATHVAEICTSENPVGFPEVPLPDTGNSEVCQGSIAAKEVDAGCDVCPVEESMVFESATPMVLDSKPTKKQQKKRKRELEQIMEDQMVHNGFIKSPCEGLRPRNRRIAAPIENEADIGIAVEAVSKKAKRQPESSVTSIEKKENGKEAHVCDLENCRMSFKTRADLLTHKRNRCTYEGCGKRFSSHKYAMLHQRVHADERPLKCTWEGCTMSFKWAWARTEHLRVHTGERPYQCKIEGCGLTFRFVSDYSRHRRKTGHYVKSPT